MYETDARGYCVKNGPHCAFAHGPHDLRQPVYDIRELQLMENEEKDENGKQIVPEDPRWNGMICLIIIVIIQFLVDQFIQGGKFQCLF